ncbi:hypothetical protein Trydic_g23486 [Trypoxylus dichotomus]
MAAYGKYARVRDSHRMVKRASLSGRYIGSGTSVMFCPLPSEKGTIADSYIEVHEARLTNAITGDFGLVYST